MGWTWQMLRHRVVAQRTVLVVVLLVATCCTALLGTFTLLLTSSEDRALSVALSRAPESATEVEVRMKLDEDDPGPGLAGGTAFLDDLLGEIPSARTAWLASPWMRVDTGDGMLDPITYLAESPLLPSQARLVDGTWPATATDDAGRLQVTVPAVAAEAEGWQVGTELHLRSTSTYDESTLVVVGVHELTGTSASWRRDVLLGAEHHPSYPVPGSFGSVFTDAWGPFTVAPGTLADGVAEVGTARLVAAPDLQDVDRAALDAARARLDDAGPRLAASTKGVATGVRMTTWLDDTLDSAVTDLAVTRVTLVLVGLLLVVLAVTVLLLAARLLAERRAAEQTLMSSRGASRRQLLGLAGLEALLVAALATAVAPTLARALFRLTTRLPVLERAGLRHDPGLPPVLWFTSAVASAALAAVLLAPLLRRRDSAVDAEQRLVRQDRRGAIARSGADVALVVLAGLATWQLTTYRSPVTPGADAAGRIDPVLVLAPALLLLAGAVLALRLVPPLARAAERAADRSRSLVGSLAAWEVSRRPSRAAGAVLVLVLAVALGSFAQSLLVTWRTSQLEQADLAVGTDVRLDRLTGSDVAQGEAVRALPGALTTTSVTDRSVGVGVDYGGGVESSRRDTSLLAVDTTHAAELLRGRLEPSWADRLEPLAPVAMGKGIPLAGHPSAILLDVDLDLRPMPSGFGLVTAVLEDAHGERLTVQTGELPLGASQDVRLELPEVGTDLWLVAVKGQVVVADGYEFPSSVAKVPVRYEIGDLRTVVPAEDDGEPEQVTSVPLDTATWTTRELPSDRGPRSLLDTRPHPGSLLVTVTLEPFEVLFEPTGFVATTSASLGTVPALATPALLEDAGAQVGQTIVLDVDGTPITVKVTGEVPYLPGHPTGSGVLVDRTTLLRTLLGSASTATVLDGWWLQVPDDQVAAVQQVVERDELGTAVSRLDARTAAAEGPLRVGVQAALWVASGAAALLAVVGLGMSATVAVRTRRLELARLQALGTSRAGLVRAVLLEHGLLAAVGALAGLALGLLLGHVVGPLVTVSADGGTPVPSVVVHWPWSTQLASLLGVLTLAAVTVAVTSRAMLRQDAATLLRIGEDR